MIQNTETREPEPSEPDRNDEELIFSYDDRRYRVRGMAKNTSYDQMKVNLMVSRDGLMHIDSLDLYMARPRTTFIKRAAIELHVDEATIKKDIGHVILALEEKQQELIRSLKACPAEKPYTMTEAEENEARQLLESPNLWERILEDFEACGVVGERTNKLLAYLAATSRKLARPLGVVIQSSSAAGKSRLMESVLAFMPPEDKVECSAMTGQALFYMEGIDLKHKILAIAEQAGAEHASYALKLLQSDGQLSIVTTGRDRETGRTRSQTYRVEGPAALLLTTTDEQPDPELVNRCMVLSVCEQSEHTHAIHCRQRQLRTLEGQTVLQGREPLSVLHQNAQRLLQCVTVVNPYAQRLTFRCDQIHARRAHEQYLTLIDTIALLYQYQRPRRTRTAGSTSFEYIEATVDDIRVANRLADKFLGRSFGELPERTERLLKEIQTHVERKALEAKLPRRAVHFTRAHIRRWTKLGMTQLKTHLKRLEEHEYLWVRSGGGRGRGVVYQLADDVVDLTASMESGLVDVDSLLGVGVVDCRKSGGNGKKVGLNGKKSAPSRPSWSPEVGGQKPAQFEAP